MCHFGGAAASAGNRLSFFANRVLLSHGTLGIRGVFSAGAGIENFCSNKLK